MQKKWFLVLILFLTMLVVSSCDKNENKTEFDLFLDEYNKYHSGMYSMDEEFYKIHTYEVVYNKNNEHTITEKKYVGRIKFEQNLFKGKISNFSYNLNMVKMKDNGIIDTNNIQVYSYDNKYYEEITGLDGIKKIYGCNDISKNTIEFAINPRDEVFWFNLLVPETIKDYFEINRFYDAIIVNDSYIEYISKFTYPDEVREDSFKVYYDDKYDITKIVRTTAYRILKDTDYTKKHCEYFYTVTLEKIDNLIPNNHVYEYEYEKEFLYDDINYSY